MAHAFGLLPLPTTAPAVGTTAGDPALDKLRDFFAAVLNAYGQTAWSAVAPTQQVVAFKFSRKPEEGNFVDRQLPAIFLWRERRVRQRLADEFITATTQLVLLWVPEPAEQEKNASRWPFAANAIYDVIVAAVHLERHTGWIDSGDTDPLAATRGSNILDRCLLT